MTRSHDTRVGENVLCASAKNAVVFVAILAAKGVTHMPVPTGDLTVAETLARWPATIAVFMQHGTACVGCVMAPFETVDEIAAIYRLDRAQLLADLAAASQFGMASGTESATTPA
jgi:hybrid cluster-associated redox disulfide protein